jgi:hypothetical protein
MDIDWKRWNSSDYTLRTDEVFEIVEVLNASCLATGNKCLVFGHASEAVAKQLRSISWATSNDEPVDATGVVAHFLTNVPRLIAGYSAFLGRHWPPPSLASQPSHDPLESARILSRPCPKALAFLFFSSQYWSIHLLRTALGAWRED